jgi:hypothetical protein
VRLRGIFTAEKTSGWLHLEYLRAIAAITHSLEFTEGYYLQYHKSDIKYRVMQNALKL